MKDRSPDPSSVLRRDPESKRKRSPGRPRSGPWRTIAGGRILLTGFRATTCPDLPMSEVTQILSAIEQGDPSAAAQLLPLVDTELRQLAAQRLSQEKPGQTLQATALVFLCLAGRIRKGDPSCASVFSRRAGWHADLDPAARSADNPCSGMMRRSGGNHEAKPDCVACSCQRQHPGKRGTAWRFDQQPGGVRQAQPAALAASWTRAD